MSTTTDHPIVFTDVSKETEKTPEAFPPCAGLSEVPRKIANWIENNTIDGPTLIVDLDLVEYQYRAIEDGLGQETNIHYAIKANPEGDVLRRLDSLGSRFDAASIEEIELAMSLGISPSHISYGSTMKKSASIALAYSYGIRLFAADAYEELDKLLEHAPEASVYIRLIIEHSVGDWPLGRKFGVSAPECLDLMDYGRQIGLNIVGISFHVGSQTRAPEMWQVCLDAAHKLWEEAWKAGHKLWLLNIGGGFPVSYDTPVMGARLYSERVMDMVKSRFGFIAEDVDPVVQPPTYIMAEPGRGLVGSAGVIASQVVLASTKGRGDNLRRWIYIDVGKFGGLSETMEESIRYRILTSRDGDPTTPCILAGPTCDSADVMYENKPLELPVTLKAGDQVWILATGAYTSSYSAVNFNGFKPLQVVCI